LRVCLVSTRYPPEDGGGIGTYTRTLATGLAARGHEVHVIASSSEGDRIEVLEGVTIHRFLPRFIRGVERWVPHLAWSRFVGQRIDELHRQVGLDLVEFPNWEGVGALYASRRLRVPVVIRVHTPYFETLAIDGKSGGHHLGDRFTCWLERRSCLAADRLVSSTVFHRQMICDAYRIEPSDIQIVALGSSLPDLPSDLRRLRSRVQRVLYLSRLEHRKGAQLLLDAVPEILREYPDVEFVLAGRDRPHAPGGLTHQAYFLDRHPDLHDRVRFLGYVPAEVCRDLYETADLFVVPTQYESFGLIFVEAMGWALPVVTCRVGGVPGVVADGGAGTLI